MSTLPLESGTQIESALQWMKARLRQEGGLNTLRAYQDGTKTVAIDGKTGWGQADAAIEKLRTIGSEFHSRFQGLNLVFTKFDQETIVGGL